MQKLSVTPVQLDGAEGLRCFDTSEHYIVTGNDQGDVTLYDRRSSGIIGKVTPSLGLPASIPAPATVAHVAVSPNEVTIAVVYSTVGGHVVVVLDVASLKPIHHHTRHGAFVAAFTWSYCSNNFYSADNGGHIVAIGLSTTPPTVAVVTEEECSVVQLHCSPPTDDMPALVVASTLRRTVTFSVVVPPTKQVVTPIGRQPREGVHGACCAHSLVYASRPRKDFNTRLWKAGPVTGAVQKTLMFRHSPDADSDVLMITGASSKINGVYERVGDHEGRPKYKRSDGGGTLFATGGVWAATDAQKQKLFLKSEEHGDKGVTEVGNWQELAQDGVWRPAKVTVQDEAYYSALSLGLAGRTDMPVHKISPVPFLIPLEKAPAPMLAAWGEDAILVLNTLSVEVVAVRYIKGLMRVVASSVGGVPVVYAMHGADSASTQLADPTKNTYLSLLWLSPSAERNPTPPALPRPVIQVPAIEPAVKDDIIEEPEETKEVTKPEPTDETTDTKAEEEANGEERDVLLEEPETPREDVKEPVVLEFSSGQTKKKIVKRTVRKKREKGDKKNASVVSLLKSDEPLKFFTPEGLNSTASLPVGTPAASRDDLSEAASAPSPHSLDNGTTPTFHAEASSSVAIPIEAAAHDDHIALSAPTQGMHILRNGNHGGIPSSYSAHSILSKPVENNSDDELWADFRQDQQKEPEKVPTPEPAAPQPEEVKEEVEEVVPAPSPEPEVKDVVKEEEEIPSAASSAAALQATMQEATSTSNVSPPATPSPETAPAVQNEEVVPTPPQAQPEVEEEKVEEVVEPAAEPAAEVVTPVEEKEEKREEEEVKEKDDKDVAEKEVEVDENIDGFSVVSPPSLSDQDLQNFTDLTDKAHVAIRDYELQLSFGSTTELGPQLRAFAAVSEWVHALIGYLDTNLLLTSYGEGNPDEVFNSTLDSKTTTSTLREKLASLLSMYFRLHSNSVVVLRFAEAYPDKATLSSQGEEVMVKLLHFMHKRELLKDMKGSLNQLTVHCASVGSATGNFIALTYLLQCILPEPRLPLPRGYLVHPATCSFTEHVSAMWRPLSHENLAVLKGRRCVDSLILRRDIQAVQEIEGQGHLRVAYLLYYLPYLFACGLDCAMKAQKLAVKSYPSLGYVIVRAAASRIVQEGSHEMLGMPWKGSHEYSELYLDYCRYLAEEHKDVCRGSDFMDQFITVLVYTITKCNVAKYPTALDRSLNRTVTGKAPPRDVMAQQKYKKRLESLLAGILSDTATYYYTPDEVCVVL